MKILKIIMILLLVFSCSTKSEITEFDFFLGKSNIETLNFMVIDFETSFLKKKYPNSTIKEAYLKYLIDIESNIQGNWEKPSKKSIAKFNKSKFKKIIYGIPDSIYSKGEYQSGTLKANISKVNNEDSLIKKLKNHYDINHFGKYRKALTIVSKKNKFIKSYLKMTKEDGMLDPRRIAHEILIADLDFDDYFIKRLIITEIVYLL